MNRAGFSIALSVLLASCGRSVAPSVQSGTGAVPPPAAYEHAFFSGKVRDFLPREIVVSGEVSVSRCLLSPATSFSTVSEGGVSFRPGDVVTANYGTLSGGNGRRPVTVKNYGFGELSSYRVAPRDAPRIFLGKVVSMDTGSISLIGTDGDIRILETAAISGLLSASLLRPASLPNDSSAFLNCRRLPDGAWEAESVTIYLPAAHQDPANLK